MGSSSARARRLHRRCPAPFRAHSFRFGGWTKPAPAWVELPVPENGLTIAAAGDLHVHEAGSERWHATVAGLDGVDLILLAGDLTADGLAAQAEILAEACRNAPAPVAAVLGNHDWHMGEEEGIAAALRRAGVRVLERESAVFSLRGLDVGVVGLK